MVSREREIYPLLGGPAQPLFAQVQMLHCEKVLLGA